jgi:plastocyanin
MVRPALAGVLCLVALVAPAAVPAAEIQGRVLVAAPLPAPAKVAVTIDQYVCGTEKESGDLVVSAAREVRNVVAWLQNPPPGGTGAGPPAATQVDQKECVFIPRVVLVQRGGTVEFLNSDRLLHNIHGMPKGNAPFNRTQPRGRNIPITFAHPEVIRINCDLHSWMRGWVVVAEHPYYAISDAQGRFRFDNLPPGTYTLNLWHERLGTATRKVNVTEGPTPVTIELKAP